jgi:di/tricarboxylate transporter
MGRFRILVSTSILVFSLILFIASFTGDSYKEAFRAGALIVFAMGFWATGVLPEYLTALIFLLIATIAKVAPAPVVFSGFFSGALWLVFGGLVIASAVKTTGFGRRLSYWLLRPSITSYAGLIASIVFLTILVGFLIPATMGRVMLLVPIVAAMSERLGFTEKSPGRKGMVLATTIGSFAPSCAVLPANVPNMVLAGASETLYKLNIHYGAYLKLHFPVIGVLKGIAIVILICILFPDRIPAASAIRDRKVAPFTLPERNLGIALSATLLLWGTDFLHGVSPAWVALAAALVCMLPVSGIFPRGIFSEGINFGPFFYVAGVLGIVAVIGKTGLSDIFGSSIIDFFGLQPGHDLRHFLSLVLVSNALNPFTTAPGSIAVLAPLSGEIAAATGIPLMTVLMTQVIGFSNIILPYHVPPVVVGLHLGRVGAGDAARLTLSLAAVSILILMPVNYLWWSFLGVFNG